MEKLLKDKVLQLGLFEEKLCEVSGEAQERFILRRNPVRQQEKAQSREQKKQSLERAIATANDYLAKHPRAKVKTQRRQIASKQERSGLSGWLTLQVKT